MSQRKAMVPVLIMGVLVLAGGVGLWLMLRGGDDAVAQRPREPISATEPPPTPTEIGTSAPTVAPSLPGETPATPGGEVKEYVVGDRRVRDHRTGDHAPIDIPPSVHPAEGRRLTSNLVHEVGLKLKVVVKECAATLPTTARGKDPHLEGQVVVAIKAKQVTVTKAVVQLRDVNDAAVDAVKKCIEEKALTLTHTAEETDLESYDINLSYAL